MIDIDANPEDRVEEAALLCGCFEQDAAELLPAKEEIIWPFAFYPTAQDGLYGTGNCQLLAGFLMEVEKRSLEIQGKLKRLDS